MRDGQKFDVTATPRKMADGTERLGIVSGDNFPLQRPSISVAAGYAVKTNLQILRLTGKALGQFFTGQRSARNTLSGPVGIYKAASSSVERFGWGGFFTTLAFLSLNLGIFNLLPIPVLDGGAIFLLLIESLLATVGLSLSLRVRERIQQVGFVMVILLMVFVITNDLLKQASVWRGGGESPPAASSPAK
jgi:regulator of sigma E protease